MTAFMHIGLILREKGKSDKVDDAIAAFTKAADAGERHAYREGAWTLWKHRGLDQAVAWL